MFEVRDEPVFTTAAMPTPQPGHAQSGSMPGIKYEQSWFTWRNQKKWESNWSHHTLRKLNHVAMKIHEF